MCLFGCRPGRLAPVPAAIQIICEVFINDISGERVFRGLSFRRGFEATPAL